MRAPAQIAHIILVVRRKVSAMRCVTSKSQSAVKLPPSLAIVRLSSLPTSNPVAENTEGRPNPAGPDEGTSASAVPAGEGVAGEAATGESATGERAGGDGAADEAAGEAGAAGAGASASSSSSSLMSIISFAPG
mmetsp:Transcript_95599/g.294952  ORF Transcript_95599/g.294952 Transcript_95599/m.294952 type:complete len:134 (+) Transcript_95599:205-606(+)